MSRGEVDGTEDDDFELQLGDHTPVPHDPGAAPRARRFREVLGHFATGVTVVTSVVDGEPVGMTCQAFASVSLEPPLVMFCASRSSQSWARIRTSGRFCVNVLNADQEELSRVMASRGHRFAGVDWRPAATGAPVVAGVAAYVDCLLEEVHPTGDHDVVIGRVQELGSREDAEPLVFHRGGYRHLG